MSVGNSPYSRRAVVLYVDPIFSRQQHVRTLLTRSGFTPLIHSSFVDAAVDVPEKKIGQYDIAVIRSDDTDDSSKLVGVLKSTHPKTPVIVLGDNGIPDVDKHIQLPYSQTELTHEIKRQLQRARA